MTDAIQKFTDFLVKNGLNPDSKHPIVADDKQHRLHQVGDKRTDTSALYSVVIEPEKAYGYFRDFKNGGEIVGWGTSMTDKKLSDEERKKEQRKLTAAKKKQREAEEKRIAEETEKAGKEYAKLKKATKAHGYIKKKKVGVAAGVKINGDGLLVIPAWGSDGGLRSYQRIWPEGKKRFRWGCQVKGAYFPIKKADSDLAVIVICEGYSTGWSIHEATGYPVIVAFDCGNLKAVTAAIKAKFPDSKLVIAYDDDQWNDFNSGYERAVKAAAEYGCDVAGPGSPEDDPDKRTDMNDLYISDGLEAVADKISAAIASQESPVGDPLYDMHLTGGEPDTAWEPDYEPVMTPMALVEHEIKKFPVKGRDLDYESKLVYKDPENRKKGLVQNSLNNAIVLLREHPEYAGTFRWNEFKCQTYVATCPKWEEENWNTFEAHQITERDKALCEAWFELGQQCKPGQANMRRAINVAAEAYSFHPVQDYMKALKWDGVPRLGTWLKHYLKAEAQDEEYLARIGTIWLVAGVRRIMQPGCKFDHMLVLEGEQSVGKSSCLRILSTFGEGDLEESYFYDGIDLSKADDRGTIMALQGNLIIECQEMAGMNKKDINELKKWLTITEDIVEVKFEQETRTHPRQFIIAGTYNPLEDVGYLRDSSGNRRFWPVRVCSSVRFDELERDREQLWAEAAHLEAQGYDIHLDPRDPIYKKAQVEQEMRVETDVWDDLIENQMERNPYGMTSDQIMEILNIPVHMRNNVQKTRIIGIVRKHGWDRKKIKTDNGWKTGWGPEKKPDDVPDHYYMPEKEG